MIYLKRILALMLVVIVTTACFSRNRPDTSAADTVAEPPPTATSTSAPVTSAVDTLEKSEVEDANQESNGTAVIGDIQIVEEIASIDRYRMKITMKSEIPNRNANIQVDAAYSKDPLAEEITMRVDENGETQTVTMLLVDGLRYMRSGEMVVQTADARMNLQELTLIQPRDAAPLGSRFTQIAEETINGRETILYRGGPDAVPTGGTAGDTFDVTAVESASIDLWIDKAEQFIVAMAVTIDGFDDEPTAHMEMRFDYYDFNSPDIVIEAPDDAISTGVNAGDDSSNSSTMEGSDNASEPRNALGKLLGYDFLLATGSEITLASNQIVQVSTIYTLDEAVNLFQVQLPANGYTFMSAVTPQQGESVLMFQKGMQVATIQITATEQGSEWNVVVAP